MLPTLKRILNKFLSRLFKKKRHIKLGLYGPPNGGKTTLANRICKDWLGEEMGVTSTVPHETREIQIKEQINIIKPRVICALGSFASKTLFKSEVRISRLRGQFRDYNGVPLMSTYHPSYLLRNPSAKRDVWEDIKMVMELLGLPFPSDGNS